MFFYVLGFFSLVGALGWLAYDSQANQPATTSAYRVESIAKNLSVYNSVVVNYAINNPSASGTIPTASLGLPTWFSATQFTHDITPAGVVRVWVDQTPNGFPENRQLLSALNDHMQGYENLGSVNATGFTHPIVGFKAEASYVATLPVNTVAIFTRVR